LQLQKPFCDGSEQGVGCVEHGGGLEAAPAVVVVFAAMCFESLALLKNETKKKKKKKAKNFPIQTMNLQTQTRML
jgi:hypothetical protein